MDAYFFLALLHWLKPLVQCWLEVVSRSIPGFANLRGKAEILLLYWLYQSLWLCGPQQTVENYFANKGLSCQSYGFSSSYVWTWELVRKESWALKNRCFWTVVLEKTLESPLDCKRWKYQNTLPVSWEICMQVKKQQLETDKQQRTGSKLGRKYVKAVCCHPAYLTYMQSTSCKMPG